MLKNIRNRKKIANPYWIYFLYLYKDTLVCSFITLKLCVYIYIVAVIYILPWSRMFGNYYIGTFDAIFLLFFCSVFFLKFFKSWYCTKFWGRSSFGPKQCCRIETNMSLNTTDCIYCIAFANHDEMIIRHRWTISEISSDNGTSIICFQLIELDFFQTFIETELNALSSTHIPNLIKIVRETEDILEESGFN